MVNDACKWLWLEHQVYEVPYSSSSSPYPKPYQNYYYNEYHEGILEIAKTFFNSLLNQLVDKTMVAAVK
jgi:hypothetical protein